MKYKLVCIDMDGTLLDKKFSIPEDNIRALKEAISKGVYIALVTGRPYNIASYFKKYLGESISVIGTNGTYFKIGDVEYKKSLNSEEIAVIYDLATKYHLTAHFKGYDMVISNQKIDEHQAEKKISATLPVENQMKFFEECSLQDALKCHQDHIMKCLMFSDDLEAVAKAKAELKQYKRLEVVSSHLNNFEAMPLGTSKGFAVKQLCEMLQVQPEEVICIGDNENDLSMIKFAGLGIAMGNAPEAIQTQADFVTDTNINCGVAKAIDRFVLNK